MWILIAVFVAGLFVFHTLERLAPIRADYRTGPGRPGYTADLVAALVNGPGLSNVAKLLATLVLLRMPVCRTVLAAWPWAAQFATYLLVNDFVRYWLHRWFHASKTLWRIHRVHHASVQMDCLSLLRIHVLEAIVKNFLLLLPFRVLGIDASVIIIYSSIDLLKGFWHHANLRNYVGPLNYVFNTAELHWWHHSFEPPGDHSNYGSILSIWDWMFGTAYWPRGHWPERIGVEGLEAFPVDYLAQLTSIRSSDEEWRKRSIVEDDAIQMPLTGTGESRCDEMTASEIARLPG